MNVHPELLDQLKRAGHDPVQVVVQLRPTGNPGAVPSPEEAVQLADAVLHRVSDEVGRPAGRTNVLRNLATMIVEADSEFVRRLISQPEVVSAMPNVVSESLLIPPRRNSPI